MQVALAEEVVFEVGAPECRCKLGWEVVNVNMLGVVGKQDITLDEVVEGIKVDAYTGRVAPRFALYRGFRGFC